MTAGYCEVETVRGSPATLIVWCEGPTAFVVDPGHGRKRAKQLAKKLSQAGEVVFFLTHHHSDHHASLAEGLLDTLSEQKVNSRVVATSTDAPAVRDPRLRVLATFSYPLHPGSPTLPFRAPSVRVDAEVEPPEGLGPLQLIPLPGHTLGQAGVIAPDGTLYAADAVFGERVLERYGTPYHLDPCTALESLSQIEKVLPRLEALQPSHGPKLPAGEAVGLLDANRAAIERMLDIVLEEASKSPLSASQAAASVSKRMGAQYEPGMLMLVEATVRGALACLHAKGLLEPVATGSGGLVWRTVKA